ncbi:hypothetical protein K402DRAFT_421732 [Aulographum hederae CBS 113979]|uniref:Uncharacterized protein n=1 Tax=Aulographum hederae CBS 113979 TaxID=1176131 RepID=A0A6G1GXW7_9PEZI|nr:hypothetical protein K402DRAFT_421732 [Aulographum hederae CBS 113979]
MRTSPSSTASSFEMASSMKNSDKDNAFSKYVLLSNQSERLRANLSLSIPSSTTPFSSHTSHATSLASSPISTYPSSTASYPPSYSPDSSPDLDISPSSFPTTEDETHARLYEINKQIKATLTELLNSTSVRHDDKVRAWVQGRLMEAEMELKRQRRRKSSVDKDLEGVRDAIAGSFGCVGASNGAGGRSAPAWSWGGRGVARASV